MLIVGHQPALGAAAALIVTGQPIKKDALWWLRSEKAAPALVVAVITPRLARGK